MYLSTSARARNYGPLEPGVYGLQREREPYLGFRITQDWQSNSLDVLLPGNRLLRHPHYRLNDLMTNFFFFFFFF
jgi:hypothetical protein